MKFVFHLLSGVRFGHQRSLLKLSHGPRILHETYSTITSPWPIFLVAISGWRFEPLPAVPWHVTLLTKPPLPFLYLCVNQNYRSYEVTTTTFSFELVYSDCEFSIINLNGGSHKIMSMSLKWKKSILTCSAMNHEKLLVGELLSLGGHIACLIATQVIPRGWQTKIPEHLKIVNSFPLMKGV